MDPTPPDAVSAADATTPGLPAGAPRPLVRAIVSAIVIFHVAAVFIGPWSMPGQTSELGATFGRAFQPYLDVLALGNGYRFFAPEPGPSHLVRYELTLDDGTLKEGFFPNRAEHKPRLLYHRYFMLTEFINSLSAGDPANKAAVAYARGYAQHLSAAENAKTVKLYLRRHYVPRTIEVRQGMRLDDKALYEERPLVTYQRD
jgi:hypothetical protein